MINFQKKNTQPKDIKSNALVSRCKVNLGSEDLSTLPNSNSVSKKIDDRLRISKISNKQLLKSNTLP